MPLDKQAAAFVQLVADAGGPSFDEMTPEEARAFGVEAWALPPSGLTSVEDIEVPGPAGKIPVRVYRPKVDDAGPLPALVFFHGGGWVVGDLETHNNVCEELADRTPCIVFSVDYRLAPEHRFPAAIDDCWAATEYVSKNAEQLGVRPGPVAVGGDSAGGNLAAAVALRARDAGLPLALQALVYPVTDATYETPSYNEFAEGFVLTKSAMMWFWEHYLGPDGDPTHPDASPLRAKDLSGLAPAYVLGAECDVLRDEAVVYADRLREAGVPTTYHCYEGQLHGFVTQPPGLFDSTPVAHEMLAAALRTAFGK